MIILAELLIEDDCNNLFLLVSDEGSIYLSKMVFDSSGFIFFENIDHHHIDFNDIHSLVHHGKCEGYVLKDNLKGKSLPLHKLDL